jgi:hypothetical protein
MYNVWYDWVKIVDLAYVSSNPGMLKEYQPVRL